MGEVGPEAWILAASPGTGIAGAEAAALAALALLRVFLSVQAAALLRVSLVFLSRHLPAATAQQWHDPFSRQRIALALGRALTLAGVVAWTVALAQEGGSNRPALLGFGLTAGAVVLVGEGIMVPLAARLVGEGIVVAGLPLLRLMALALWPVAKPVAALLAAREGEPRGENGEVDEEEMEEELQAFIDVGEARGILEGEEGELVEQIVAFGDTVVREVMTPRTEMVTLSESAAVEEARRLFVESRHSRLPVYRGTLDEVVGVLSVRDLLAVYPTDASSVSITDLMRPVHLVPETRKVADLLRDLQRERAPLAVVVDEYGGTAGLVTIEDLLEEIVGDIKDEHELEEEITASPDGGWVVDGLCSIDDLGEAVGHELRREGVDSVGGLVFSTLGRLPEVGETLRFENLELTVLELDHRRIARLHVRLLPGPEPAGESP